MAAELGGATPLDPDEAQELLPTHVATREELNAWEQANILRAERWAFEGRRRDVLTTSFLRRLHKKMFDDTWSWAGRFQWSDKNSGIDWADIPVAIEELCKDASHWIDHAVYDVDEAATRFHHRLTQIHPFPNGNGRHARLAADMLLRNHARPRFTWGGGGGNPHGAGAVRKDYINALREADAHDMGPLLAFVRRP